MREREIKKYEQAGEVATHPATLLFAHHVCHRDYERTEEQNEELGLLDINVDKYD